MHLPYKYSLKSFTFIELIIVVSIILIVTAVAIPAFDSMAEKKNFRVSVENFATQLRLARNKGLSGVGVGAKNIPPFEYGKDILLSWGINPSCDGTVYEINFKYIDDSDAAKPTLTATDQIRSLDEGIKFSAATCGDVYFGRLTGLPDDAQTINISNSKYNADVIVNSSGQISIIYN